MPAGRAKRRLFDGRLHGFVAEQRATTITFYFRYTDVRGRTREIKLGRLADVTVDQARRRAEQLKAAVSLGSDPAAETERKRAVPTFAEFVEDRYLPHVRARLRSVRNIEAQLRLRLVPWLGRKALDEITITDVAEVRRRLIGLNLSNSSVNRNLATLRSMFNLARVWGIVDGRNPASAPGMLRETHRDTYLSAAETQALMKALDKEPNQIAAAALALLVLTGARKNEVLRAKWSDLDSGRSLLTVPVSKNGRPRYIPLSPSAARVLEMRFHARNHGEVFIFPGTRSGCPLEDLRSTWKRAKRVAGLSADLRIHDLRHSFASALANAGTPLSEIGVILGHRDLATTSRYAHHAPQRLVATATVAAVAWDLSPKTTADAARDEAE